MILPTSGIRSGVYFSGEKKEKKITGAQSVLNSKGLSGISSDFFLRAF